MIEETSPNLCRASRVFLKVKTIQEPHWIFFFFFYSMRTEHGVKGFKATATRTDPPRGPSGPLTLLCLISPSITPTRFKRPFNWDARHCFQVCGSICGKYIVRCFEKKKKSQTEKKNRDKHESFSLLLIHWQQLETQSNFSCFNICGTAERRERTDIIRGRIKGGMKLHPSPSVVLNSWELWWMSLG